jgi:diguanylate cyclase (GGDEF)-like protein
LRTSDLLGRIGGEEFALLMPQTPIVGALEVAERIRCAVEGVLVVSGEIKVHCTVSIGIAQWGGDGDAVAALVARGDNAMYAAKRAGRNRVCADPGDGLDGQSSLFPPQCLLP